MGKSHQLNKGAMKIHLGFQRAMRALAPAPAPLAAAAALVASAGSAVQRETTKCTRRARRCMGSRSRQLKGFASGPVRQHIAYKAASKREMVAKGAISRCKACKG